jgi:hypothetical protein
MMFFRHFAAAVVLALLSFPLFAENGPAETPEEGSVEWIVRAFLKEKSMPNWQRYYTGDMKLYGSRQTPGATYHDSKYELDVRVNEQDEDSAAVAATIVDRKANQQTDFYLFLRRDDMGWRLYSVRNFMPPRGMGQMYAALAAKGKSVDARDMRELSILGALQYNDWALKEGFKKRRDELAVIVTELTKRGVTDVIHGGQRSQKVDQKTWERIRDTGLNFVQLQENGSVEFNAAAFGESAVGYMYVPESVSPPKASPDDYILVERLDGPWHLYRRQ